MPIATEFKEVSKGIWSWSAYDEDVRTDLFSTVIAADDGLVLIDPVLLVPEMMNKLSRMGPFAAIVLTNANHTRDVSRFREYLSAPVYAHPDAVGELTAPVDGALRVTRRVGGNLEVIELPGGGLGEVALYDSHGSLHFGDAVIRTEKNGVEILPAKYCSDPSLLAKSLQTLAARTFHIATFAHGTPLLENAEEALRPILAQT